MTDAGQWKGKRVRLVSCTDPWTQLKPGATGPVQEYDPTGGPAGGPILSVKWDNGEILAALVDAVRHHVADRRVLDAIGREVEQLVAVEGVVAGGAL